jgi:hypothetical protein
MHEDKKLIKHYTVDELMDMMWEGVLNEDEESFMAAHDAILTTYFPNWKERMSVMDAIKALPPRAHTAIVQATEVMFA